MPIWLIAITVLLCIVVIFILGWIFYALILDQGTKSRSGPRFYLWFWRLFLLIYRWKTLSFYFGDQLPPGILISPPRELSHQSTPVKPTVRAAISTVCRMMRCIMIIPRWSKDTVQTTMPEVCSSQQFNPFNYEDDADDFVPPIRLFASSSNCKMISWASTCMRRLQFEQYNCWEKLSM